MTLLEMPRGYYADDRATMYDLLARHAQVRPLDLRVALSNVFVTMTALRRKRPA